MKPIAPLMTEHRLIERMITILKREVQNVDKFDRLNPILIQYAVNFMRTYVEQTHHGKEEDILFRELKKKKLSLEHRRIMNELQEEHKISAKMTKELVKANSDYLRGKRDILNIVFEKIAFFIDFYPPHIEKEDKYFFIPAMNYFTDEEQAVMLEKGHEFDRKMIHLEYQNVVSDFEKEYEIPLEKRADRTDYL